MQAPCTAPGKRQSLMQTPLTIKSRCSKTLPSLTHSRNYIPVEQLKKENYAAWQRMASGGYGKKVDLSNFRDTVVRGLESVIEANRGKRAAVFCHGGVINIWATHCLGLEPRLFSEITYCSISRFMCASSGQRNVASLNETQHLIGLV